MREGRTKGVSQLVLGLALLAAAVTPAMAQRYDDYDDSGGRSEPSRDDRRDDDRRYEQQRSNRRDDREGRDDDRGYERDADRSRPGAYETNRSANLFERPSASSQVIRRLRAHTRLDVVQVTEQWYRVRATQQGNPDGWIRRSYADPAGTGRRVTDGGDSERVRFRAGIFRVVNPTKVRSAPDMESRSVATLREGQEVRVVGKTGSWYRIESESSNRPPGYVAAIAVERVGDAR